MFTRRVRFPVAFTVLGFGLAFSWSPARADDADPVKEKLYQAKKNYDADVQKFKKTISDSLDKREADARKVGNKKVVDQVKAERAAFEKTGELPQGVTAPVRDAGTAARTKLEKAYAAALKDYLRTKRDDAADAIEKERQEFRLASSFLFGKRTHLVALQHFDVNALPNFFTNDGTNHEGNKLKVDGELVPHTIFLHPPEKGSAQVSYPLSGKWTAFRASVGVPKVEGNGDPRSPLTFEVAGDGKTLWKSEPVAKADAFQTFTVNVEKVKTLTLGVRCPESNHAAWGIWLEPILGE